MGMIVLSCLVTWSFTLKAWDRTDVDSFFLGYGENNAITYRENCKKPKDFAGFNKFKVSCYSHKYDHEFISSASSGRDITALVRTRGWTLIASVEDVNSPIISDDFSGEIFVLEKAQSEYPNCKRRVFVSFSDGSDINWPKKGDTVYFADPRKLYCRSGT